MAFLIIYISKHGTTEKVVHMLQKKFGKDTCQILNLADKPITDLSGYKTIIIGGSIHVGQIQRQVKDFCEKHEKELLEKKIGLFICFMEKDKGQLEFDMAYPEILRKKALAHGLFGGELLFEKMNFIERTIIRKIKKVKTSVSELDLQAIDDFADTMLMS